MASRRGQVLARGVSVLLAAGVGVVTNVVTDRPSWSLVTGLGMLVVLLAVVEMWLAGGQGSRNVHATGPGSVAVGGDARGRIRTRVRGLLSSQGTSEPGDGVRADGPGAAAVGGDADDVATDVSTDGDGPAPR